jgi:signal transduction histidine kinase
MKHFLLGRFSVPLLIFGGLVALACLTSTWYINRLQSDLARTVRQDAAGMEAANELQVRLRQLRTHSLLLAADPSASRRRQVSDDRQQVTAALADARLECQDTDDHGLLNVIERGYHQYETNLGVDALPDAMVGIALIRWADSHPVQGLLVPCRELADRQRERMDRSLERSESQTTWAGRVLLGLAVAGALGGLLSGYVTARGLTQRVARLSVRVQAVRTHLDQDVGAMTVERPQHFGDLDLQLDNVVGRVKEVCRKLQEQERDLLRVEQLAAVGQLAAGVAHEVRNPLTGIKFLVEAGLRTANPTPLSSEDLQLIRQEVVRMERTVQDLLVYARNAPPVRRSLDLRELVAEAAEVARSRSERKPVAIRVEVPDSPTTATVDRDQVLSLLTNLLFNAIDAAPPGGQVGMRLNCGPSSSLKVEVTDNGPGIDAAIADSLFTPFVTTKPTGSGLGLTVARQVARDHGGTLTATNCPSGGACFTLTLGGAEEPFAKVPDRR